MTERKVTAVLYRADGVVEKMTVETGVLGVELPSMIRVEILDTKAMGRFHGHDPQRRAAPIHSCPHRLRTGHTPPEDQ